MLLYFTIPYGLKLENNLYDIWFEPITDELDGFVMRSKDGVIIKIYSEDKLATD